MVEILFELADRRLILCNLLVIREQLRVELGFALHEIGFLESHVHALGCLPQGWVEISLGKLRLGPSYHSFKACNLRSSCADVGGSEGRIEGCQELTAFDALAFLYIEGLDDRRVERL